MQHYRWREAGKINSFRDGPGRRKLSMDSPMIRHQYHIFNSLILSLCSLPLCCSPGCSIPNAWPRISSRDEEIGKRLRLSPEVARG